MAVENETISIEDGSHKGSDISVPTANETDIDKGVILTAAATDAALTENISSETVVVEMELEKKNSLGTNATPLAKGKQDDGSLENVQLEEDGEEGIDGDDVVDSKDNEKQRNSYAAKKTVAQGMMDIALITANANQLRFIIEFNSHSPTYYLTLLLITVSLILQVAVGVSLIFKGRMDLRGQSKHKNAKRINNYVVVGIFLVTIINVFIASFTITGNGGGNNQ